MHYRVNGAAAPASFVRGLLGLLDRSDPLLAQDRTAARALAASATPVGRNRAWGARLRVSCLPMPRMKPQGPLLLVGVRAPGTAGPLPRTAGDCTALAHVAARGAVGARLRRAAAGLPARVIETASADGFSDADFARCAGRSARMLLDQPGGGAAALPQLLRRARAALAPAGHLWLFERYDSLDSAGDRVVEHPLARLRRLLSDAGLECEKHQPRRG